MGARAGAAASCATSASSGSAASGASCSGSSAGGSASSAPWPASVGSSPASSEGASSCGAGSCCSDSSGRKRRKAGRPAWERHRTQAQHSGQATQPWQTGSFSQRVSCHPLLAQRAYSEGRQNVQPQAMAALSTPRTWRARLATVGTQYWLIRSRTGILPRLCSARTVPSASIRLMQG